MYVPIIWEHDLYTSNRHHDATNQDQKPPQHQSNTFQVKPSFNSTVPLFTAHATHSFLDPIQDHRITTSPEHRRLPSTIRIRRAFTPAILGLAMPPMPPQLPPRCDAPLPRRRTPVLLWHDSSQVMAQARTTTTYTPKQSLRKRVRLPGLEIMGTLA